MAEEDSGQEKTLDPSEKKLAKGKSRLADGQFLQFRTLRPNFDS